MKKIIQFIILAFPLLANGQRLDIFQKLKFIEEFTAYHIEMTSKEEGDWSVYNERKKHFDEKIQSLVANKDSIIIGYNEYLMEEERKKLNTLFDKYFTSTGSNERLKNELLSWKEDRNFLSRQNILYNFFTKLDYLIKESDALTNNSDDIMAVLIFESRLEEVVDLIKELK